MAEKKKKKVSRRKFIVRGFLGGMGVLVGVTYLARNPLRRGINEFLNSGESPYLGDTDDPVMWFTITPDSVVTLHSPKVEMGQGTFTGLAQIAADELEVTLDQLQVVHAQTDTGSIDQFATGGSTSISGLWQPLRELSATMREMLKAEAAKKLGVEPGTVKASKGTVTGGGQSLTYGQVVAGVTEWTVPDTPKLKPVKEYKHVGQPVPRIDLDDKVFGTPMFGMDATLPGMLYGAVVRPTQIGATYVGADVSAAEGMPGVVKIVQEPDFVGVVAKSMTEAHNAKQAIKAEWQVEKVWETKDIEEMIQVGAGTPWTIQKTGKAKSLLDEAEQAQDGDFVWAEYNSPLGAHAQMEPNGCLASVEADKATIMMSTQVVKLTRAEVAQRLGFEEAQVNLVPTYLGGGFGRRLHTPNAVQAAVMSKAVGKPVKCFFDRKEEFQHDTFRPPTHHVLRAKLNADGMIEAIEHNVSSGDVAFTSPLVPGFADTILGADIGAWRGGMIQYRAIPNFSAVSWRVQLPFATSWWRSLGLLANTFAIESFIDELAERAGKDPIEYRLAQIQDDEAGDRLKAVIKRCAELGKYQNKPANGRAMGFACSTDASTPAAHVAEVSVTGNDITVHKVTCVMDPGMVVNPDQVRAQCEGSIIMGMSAAMHERMYVEKGQLRPIIYGPYQMAMMKHAPKEIVVDLLQGIDKPGAVGEPPLGPIGAAVANAVYRATGKRLRNMPIQMA